MQSPAESAAAPGQEGPDDPRWPAMLYGLIALAAVAFAFVGLSTSSYWIDELFTAYLIDPGADLAQRMQRILRDVHPPLYYLALHGWADVFGRSEAALRAFSALCASTALLVFAAGMRRVARPAAIAFACAVAATSTFWFEQAQNARNYTWLMLLTSALLAAALQLRRRVREAAGFPFATWLLLSLLGAAASLSHSYLLLGTGMLLLYLIATLPDLRLRAALALSGAAILGAYLVFAWFQLHAMERDFSADWFRSDLRFIGQHLLRALGAGLSHPAAVVVAALLVALAWRRARRSADGPRRAADDADWAAGLAAFVIVGGIAGGVAVTQLFAPSFSFRNVLTFAPFGWLLLARLYDAAGPRASTRRGAVAAVLIALVLAAQQIALAPGRFLQRNEPWRASAGDVLAQTSCSGAIPAVVMAEAYSGQEADLRMLAERHYHGYYVPQRRVEAFTPAELLRRYETGDAAGGCPLLAWGVRGLGEQRAVTLAMALANRPVARAHGVAVHEFPQYLLRGLSWRKRLEGFVFVLAGKETLESSTQDRIAVTRVDEPSPPDTATFLIRTWHDGKPMREERAVVPLAALNSAPLRDWRQAAAAVDGSAR
ncbi:hypothetical protein [Dokdonella ginsengisoli]|uniref:Glycosyltransferase RgtA/B/C/D-like domain-containing protein n=1 Tax=Dokdonella ginsengisoli TaxID=363846 RepID=A0ABV9QT24_9GAMM